MRPSDRPRAARLRNQLAEIQASSNALPGVRPAGHLDCLVEQLIESIRRIEFVHHTRDANLDPRRADPTSELFDPLRAAVIANRHGQIDEAWWLVFLATHCGKHAVDGWRLARDLYGRLGNGRWDWATISAQPALFRPWLVVNEHTLRGGDGISRRFSNHRKYESLRAGSHKSTARVIESYVAWVNPPRTHDGMVRDAHKIVGQNPKELFRHLYESMDGEVLRFGRLGRFDFLTMLGKLGISPVDPPSAYLEEATGPRKGANLLFEGAPNPRGNARTLNEQLTSLNDQLSLGMQVWEDALCNWQKSPDRFVSFRG
jgi:hypothetical protein